MATEKTTGKEESTKTSAGLNLENTLKSSTERDSKSKGESTTTSAGLK